MTDMLTLEAAGPDAPRIPVALRRSARARRMTLRVGRLDGAAVLSIPARTSRGEAAAFLARQEAWLRRAVAAVPPRRVPRIGGTVPILGIDRAILPAPGRAARWTGEAVLLPEARPGPGLAALLRELARRALVPAVERHAGALGRTPGRISLRDTRSRWGSCTSRGDLMFCWRIAMAPETVIDYLAAHEVAHLAHMDHSPRFWACVERLCPGHVPARAWLRAEGAALQAWDLAERTAVPGD